MACARFSEGADTMCLMHTHLPRTLKRVQERVQDLEVVGEYVVTLRVLTPVESPYLMPPDPN